MGAGAIVVSVHLQHHGDGQQQGKDELKYFQFVLFFLLLFLEKFRKVVLSQSLTFCVETYESLRYPFFGGCRLDVQHTIATYYIGEWSQKYTCETNQGTRAKCLLVATPSINVIVARM